MATSLASPSPSSGRVGVGAAGTELVEAKALCNRIVGLQNRPDTWLTLFTQIDGFFVAVGGCGIVGNASSAFSTFPQPMLELAGAERRERGLRWAWRKRSWTCAWVPRHSPRSVSSTLTGSPASTWLTKT